MPRKKSKRNEVKRNIREKLVVNEQNSPAKNKVLIFSIAILALIALLLLKNIFGKGKSENLINKVIPQAITKMVGDKTKLSVGALKDVSGVYEFELTLGEGAQAKKYTSYITKDGQFLFTSGIKLSTLNQPAAATDQTQAKKLTCNDLSKSDTPKLTAFIVSNCPYGLQMQRVFKKTLNEQPALEANLDVKYIGSISGDKITSMHGDQEATENLKQICIREEQKNLYWPYLSCYMQEGKTDDCLTSTGVDTAMLEACTTDKTRGLAYAKKDFDLANKLQVGSSPTLVLNDKQVVSEFDFGGRIANSIKQIVCCASKTQADFCKTDLTKDEVAVAFSATDAPQQQTGTDGAANAANCGTQ